MKVGRRDKNISVGYCEPAINRYTPLEDILTAVSKGWLNFKMEGGLKMKIMLVVIEEDVINESTHNFGVFQFVNKPSITKRLCQVNYLKSERHSNLSASMDRICLLKMASGV